MPLFNNWPYVDLSKLNLDWIMKKIKHVEEAEATADEVLEAAATIIPAIDQIHDDADRAEAAATAAAASAADAAGAVTSCGISEQNAANSAQSALGHVMQAQAAKEEAAASAEEASRSAGTASTAALNAGGYADAAAISAGNAQNYAERAETAASTTGFRAYAGEIPSETTKSMQLPDGSYAFIAYAEDSANSSCLDLLEKAVTMLGHRKLVYNGNGDRMVTFGSTETLLTVRNDSGAMIHYLLVGCEAF